MNDRVCRWILCWAWPLLALLPVRAADEIRVRAFKARVYVNEGGSEFGWHFGPLGRSSEAYTTSPIPEYRFGSDDNTWHERTVSLEPGSGSGETKPGTQRFLSLWQDHFGIYGYDQGWFEHEWYFNQSELTLEFDPPGIRPQKRSIGFPQKGSDNRSWVFKPCPEVVGHFGDSIVGWPGLWERPLVVAAPRLEGVQREDTPFDVRVDVDVDPSYLAAGLGEDPRLEVTLEGGSLGGVVRRQLESRGGAYVAKTSESNLRQGRSPERGWLAEYWSNQSLSGISKVRRIEALAGANWELRSPDPALPVDGFSARWTGELRPPQGGAYQLILRSDDGTRLWINDQLVIDNWRAQAVTEKAETYTFTAGQAYRVRIEYFEQTHAAVCQFLWVRPGGVREEVSDIHVRPAADYERYTYRFSCLPATNASGTGTLTAVARLNLPPTSSGVSGGFLRKQSQIPFTVEPVDDPPQVTLPGRVELSHRAARVVPFEVRDVDTEARDLQVVVRAASRSGLLAEIWSEGAGTNTEPKVVRVDPVIDFLWGQDPPAPGVSADRFRVRWTGELVPRETATYTLSTESDDGSWLWINDRMVVDNGGNHGMLERSGEIRLEAGVPVRIRVEVEDTGGGAGCRVRWAHAGRSREVIPGWAYRQSSPDALWVSASDPMLGAGLEVTGSGTNRWLWVLPGAHAASTEGRVEWSVMWGTTNVAQGVTAVQVRPSDLPPVAGRRGDAWVPGGNTLTSRVGLSGDGLTVDLRLMRRPTGSSGAEGVLLLGDAANARALRLSVRSDGHLAARVGAQELASVNPLPVGTWAQALVTVSGSQLELVVGGQRASRSLTSVGALTGQQWLVVGSDAGPEPTGFGGGGFGGALDEVRVWNRVMTWAEVSAMERAGGAESGLVSCFPLDRTGPVGASDYLPNRVGGAPNGILGGGTFERIPDRVEVEEDSRPRLGLSGYDPDGTAIGFEVVRWTNLVGVVLDGSGGSVDVQLPPDEPARIGTLLEGGFEYRAVSGNQASASAEHQVAVRGVDDVPVVGSEGSLSLDGDGDYVRHRQAVTINGSFTLEGWARMAVDGGLRVMVSLGSEGAPRQRLELGFEDRRAFLRQGGETNVLRAATPAGTNWVHLAAVYDAATGIGRLWVNGEAVASGELPSWTAVTGVWLGRSFTGSGAFHGELDDVRIWNRSRSPQELRADAGRPLGVGELGLVASWRLDAYEGTGAVEAVSGNRSLVMGDATWTGTGDAVPAGVTWRGALDFDGVRDEVDLGNVSVTGDMTLEFWVRWPGPRHPGDRQNPVAKAFGGEGTVTLEPGGGISFYYGLAGSDGSPYSGSFSAGAFVKPNEWTHVAIVRRTGEGGRIQMYRNGVRVFDAIPQERWGGFAADPLPEAAASPQPLRLGRGYASRFRGQLAQVRVWNVARSANEVADNHRRQLAQASGLVGNWPLDGRGDMGRIADLSGGARDGRPLFRPRWQAYMPEGFAPPSRQRFLVPEDGEFLIPAIGFDRDATPPVLSSGFVLSEPARHGTLEVRTTPTAGWLYRPQTDFVGEDSFAYAVVRDGATSAPVRVFLTVQPQNDPPVLDPVEGLVIVEGEGPGLKTVRFSDAETVAGELEVQAESADSRILAADGIRIERNSSKPGEAQLILTPRVGEIGRTEVTVTVSDGEAVTARRFVVEVRPVLAFSLHPIRPLDGYPGTRLSGIARLGHAVGSAFGTNQGQVAIRFTGFEGASGVGPLPSTGTLVGLPVVAEGPWIGMVTQSTNGVQEAWRLEPGSPPVLVRLTSLSGATQLRISAIQRDGRLVGDALANGLRVAFQSVENRLEILGPWPTNVVESWANAIHPGGAVVGQVRLRDATTNGFLSVGGSIRLLPPPVGYAHSVARGIGPDGLVVGSLRVGGTGGWRAAAFLPSVNGWVPLVVPEGTVESEAWAVNAQGRIVGRHRVAGGRWRAFIHDGGRAQDLTELTATEDAPRWELAEAVAISDDGFVAVNGVNEDGAARGAVLVPAVAIGTRVPRPPGIADQTPDLELIEAATTEDTVGNAFYWSSPDRKLYPLRPVLARLRWPLTSGTVRQLVTNLIGGVAHVSSIDLGTTEHVTTVFRAQWPVDPDLHVVGAPVIVRPTVAGFGFGFIGVAYTTAAGAGVEASTSRFDASGEGWTVLQYVEGGGVGPDPTAQPSRFTVARSVRPGHARLPTSRETWPIGVAITHAQHRDPSGLTGFVMNPAAAFDGVGPDAAVNRMERSGRIIPVNVDLPGTTNDLAVVWYQPNLLGVAWHRELVTYDPYWPTDAPTIVIASGRGSGLLAASRYRDPRIYHQPAPGLAGFNPNEEHAMLVGGVAYALRSDLNVLGGESLPYVLVKYRDPVGDGWNLQAFRVVATDAVHPRFQLAALSGQEIQPPEPLSLLPLSPLSSAVGGPVYRHPSTGRLYARAAGPDGGPDVIQLRYWYPFQPEFHWNAERYGRAMPAVGESVPWLDRLPGGIEGTPVDVECVVRWPANAPRLELGRTLAEAAGGLPGVLGMASVEVLHDSTGGLAGSAGSRVYDPLSERRVGLARGTTNFFVSPEATGRVRTSDATVAAVLGLRRRLDGRLEQFVDLPKPLAIRFLYDPVTRELVFRGVRESAAVGEPLLLPNIMTVAERDDLTALIPADVGWTAAVHELWARTRNPNLIDRNGDRIADSEAVLVGLTTRVGTNWLATGFPTNAVLRSAPAATNQGWAALPNPPRDWELWMPTLDAGGLRSLFQIPIGLAGPSGRSNALALVVTNRGPFRTNVLSSPTGVVESLVYYLGALNETQRFPTVTTRLLVPGGGVQWGVGTVFSEVVEETFGPEAKVLTTSLLGSGMTNGLAGRRLPMGGTSGIERLEGTLREPVDGGFTWMAWLRRNDELPFTIVDGTGDAVAPAAGVPAGFRVRYETSSGRNRLQLTDGVDGGSSVTEVDLRLPVQAWFHLALVRDAVRPEVRVVLNGVEVAAVGTRSASRFQALRLLQGLSGEVEEMVLWAAALDAAEIGFLRTEALLGQEEALAAYWTFNQESGWDRVWDFSSQGNHLDVRRSGGAVPTPWPDRTPPPGIAQAPRFLVLGENTSAATAGLPPTLHVIEVGRGPFQGRLHVIAPDNPLDERITLRHGSDFGGEPEAYEFEWYYHPAAADFRPEIMPGSPGGQGWVRMAWGAGLNSVTIGTGSQSSLLTLSDNWWVMRYRVAGGGWSGWIGDPAGTLAVPRAQLVEGWVKRALSGLNPYNQRTAELGSGEVNTVVSMIRQAGPRYEGPVALGPAAAASQPGLIEIYQTVLNRATDLSIGSGHNYEPANTALLFAASRLANLHALLGNEAYADAQDPTIGFTTTAGGYGSAAPGIFAFQNQFDSLLEEELALLRGRDDSAAGTTVAPVYNRVYWNFTRDNGELAYSQVYNITDLDRNGVLNAVDARLAYPQGHGDAWGHYLTALKEYYRLLQDPDFTWIPRSEFISLSGIALKVDYLDERKFAGVAAAKARVGTEIVDLARRQAFNTDPEASWASYSDPDPERAWGVGEWARRAGTGAYFDWLLGNALLPAVDPDPSHTSIDRVDRQTVRELADVATQVEAIQSRLDQVDEALNPLGLAEGVVPFDIDPSLVDPTQPGGTRTHFEQIQGRAVQALRNAVVAFDHANQFTETLRRDADTEEAFNRRVADEERSYRNRLIEVFGTPYPGDLGPGGTYPADYAEADYLHYLYVDVADILGVVPGPPNVIKAYFKGGSTGFRTAGPTSSWLGLSGERSQQFFFPSSLAPVRDESAPLIEVPFPVSAGGYAFQAPAGWGRRRVAGRIQLALMAVAEAQAALGRSRIEYANAVREIERSAETLNLRYGLRAEQVRFESNWDDASITLTAAMFVFGQLAEKLTAKANAIKDTADVVTEALPKTVGLANDVTAPARAAVKKAGLLARLPFMVMKGYLDNQKDLAETKKAVIDQKLARERVEIRFRQEVIQLLNELQRSLDTEGVRRAALAEAAALVDRRLAELSGVVEEGLQLLEERRVFRQRAAADTQKARYRDMTFRVLRNDALNKYRAQFDLAARFAYLSAAAYDYEVNLAGTDTRSAARLLQDIVQQRTLGRLLGGEPDLNGGGLAGILARLRTNFDVLKPQLGLNNPQLETDEFSLRAEWLRIGRTVDVDGRSSDDAWRAALARRQVDDLWTLPEFRRFCRPFAPESAGPQPGIVVRFRSTVTFGKNFFGEPLGPEDGSYDPSAFATRIRSVGLWFEGYQGIGLSRTPRAYLVPAGLDVLRLPEATDFTARTWRVIDQKIPIPLPMPLGFQSNPNFLPGVDSVSGSAVEVRRHTAMRAYDWAAASNSDFNNSSDLIGRSVWNTEWILIIPGGTLLSDPEEGLRRFLSGVRDIKLRFRTYTYSGN